MADVLGSGNKQDKWVIRATELINFLNDNKSPLLMAGSNISLTPNQDGTITVAATGGGGGGNVDDVQVNGTSVVDANHVAQITSYKELTQAEYDALPASKLTDGILYCIKDGEPTGSKFAPVIYSTAERQIGVYYDGKPLYEKTLVRDFDSSTTGTEYTYEHGIENIDTCVSMEGHWVNTTNGQIQKGRIQPTSASSNNTTVNATISINLYLFSRTNLTWTIGSTWASQGYYETRKLIATVRYTKTTDSPGVGTWGTSGIVPCGTLLWKGTFSGSGDITIPDLNNWLVLEVINDVGVPIFGNGFCGAGSMGKYNSNSIDQYSYRFDKTSTGWTVSANSRGIYRNGSLTTYGSGEWCVIKEVIGLIRKPNV